MKRLTKAQVLMLHSALIAQTGGSPEIIRPEMLDSAVNAPLSDLRRRDAAPRSR